MYKGVVMSEGLLLSDYKIYSNADVNVVLTEWAPGGARLADNEVKKFENNNLKMPFKN